MLICCAEATVTFTTETEEHFRNPEDNCRIGKRDPEEKTLTRREDQNYEEMNFSVFGTIFLDFYLI